MKCAIGHCGHCQFGPLFICKDGPVLSLRSRARSSRVSGAVTWRAFDRSSPSGNSPHATVASSASSIARTNCWRSPAKSRSRISSRRRARRSKVHTIFRSSKVRSRRRMTRSASRRSVKQSRFLITIGACATAGGIQALRNFADVREYVGDRLCAAGLYPNARDIDRRSADHVKVDFELRGCPINKQQLVEVIQRFLAGRKPQTPPHSVCVECKIAGNRLRHGRSRNAVSGTRHPCRLRRALSVVQSRLLWLLRPDGDAQYAVAVGMVGQARHG